MSRCVIPASLAESMRAKAGIQFASLRGGSNRRSNLNHGKAKIYLLNNKPDKYGYLHRHYQ